MNPDPRGWNPRKSRSAPRSAILPSCPPTHRPGPIVAIKTLVATKDGTTLTVSWHFREPNWKMVALPDPLKFLIGSDNYLDAVPLLAAKGWAATWHDSQVQTPVPILELEGQPQ